jgi:putative polyhydroxyalkanoate system protein
MGGARRRQWMNSHYCPDRGGAAGVGWRGPGEYHARKTDKGETRMAEITIVHKHALTHKKAREAAQKVAEKLAEEYDLEWEWEGEVLHFERSGVQGNLTLEPKQAEMFIKLGFLMSAFAPTIEAKVAENMKKVFGAA